MTSNEIEKRWINLAQPRLGADVVFASDEFFAPKERLIGPEDPIFIAGKFDDHGKWMDGWESRRRRGGGYDYCIVHLGHKGLIRAVDIDTRHFTGNFPPEASLDICTCSQSMPDDAIEWAEIVPKSPLSGDHRHLIEFDAPMSCTHVRLNIYPDGGVARLRLYGTVERDWSVVNPGESIDLIAIENGGRAIGCNDEHFGSISNVIAPGLSLNMGDGWETRRRRDSGYDWAVFALGHRGVIDQIVVDTTHFKGNYPEYCSVEGALVPTDTDLDLEVQSATWSELLPRQPLNMDCEHAFKNKIQSIGAISHVQLNIFPDGGVSRFRLFGTLA